MGLFKKKSAPAKAAKKEEKKAKKAEKKAINKAKEKKGIKLFVKKLGDKAKSLGKDAPFAVLLPFKGVMKKKLDKAGITHDNSLKDISIKFAKSLGKMSHFEELHVSGLYEYDDDYLHAAAVSMRTAAKPQIAKTVITATPVKAGIGQAAVKAATGDVAGAVGTVIKTIVDYFKNLKDRKAKGEKLSEEEDKILVESEKVADQIVEAGKEEVEKQVATSIKDFLFSWKGGVALLVLIGLIYAAFKGQK